MPARAIRNTARMIAIAYTLAREDALFIFTDTGYTLPLWFGRLFRRRSTLPKGKRLCNAIEKLGPTFIKLGQTLSTRSDLIGEELAEALASLRDNLPPFDSRIARTILEEELGGPLEQHFSAFSAEPVAAASIAQVHKARTNGEQDVAVKILRPGIRDAFARDLELFYWLAEIIEHRLPHWRRLKPLEVVRTFRESVAFELDLRYEAAAATELAKNTQNDPGFRVPRVDWNLTSERVMVLEWVDGTPLSDIASLHASGHDLNAILATASEIFFKQVFRDGFFHADLHPGNLFIDREGNIVAVDFGIMGRLDWRSRLYVAEILRGFLNEDYRHVAEVHFRAGYVPPTKSVDNFTLACMAIAKPILDKPLHEISVAKLLGQLFKVTETFEMETQPQLLLLQKTMVVIEGVGRMLNPSINMWEMARSPIEQWAAENLSPLGKLKETAREAQELVHKLPELLHRAEHALSRLSDPEGLRIHAESLNELSALERRKQRQWLALAWTCAMLAGVYILTHL